MCVCVCVCVHKQVLAEHNLEELSMRNRVLQDDMKAMRQECTERWVSHAMLHCCTIRLTQAAKDVLDTGPGLCL